MLRLLFFSVSLSICLCAQPQTQEPTPAESVQLSISECDKGFANGAYENARQSFEAAWQKAQRLPVGAPVRYEILKRLTTTTAAAGQFEAAESCLEQAIAWRESTAGHDDSKLADDLLLSINFNLRTKNFDRAGAAAKRVWNLHIASYTAESLPVADDLLRMGHVSLSAGSPRDALHFLSEALDLRTRLASLLDPGLLPILDAMNEAFGAIPNGTEIPPFTVRR